MEPQRLQKRLASLLMIRAAVLWALTKPTPGANPEGLPNRPTRQVIQVGEITELRRVDERASIVDFEIVMHPDISSKCSIHADPEARAPGPKARWLTVPDAS